MAFVEDLRRFWYEWRGQGQYVSVHAVERAAQRADEERRALLSPDVPRAAARNRARLKRAR